MLAKLYPYRFKIFFFSQVSLLFSSLVVPAALHEAIVAPMLLLINLGAGILFLAQKQRMFWLLVILLIASGTMFSLSLLKGMDQKMINFIEMGSSFLYYAIVSLEIIKQVWKAVSVDENVILGLISGDLSLCLIGFFICMSVEVANPGSFRGLGGDPKLFVELIYYSYITLLTIGYGDIIPVTNLARNSSVGQMYLVIITAGVVGKYIGQHQATEEA